MTYKEAMAKAESMDEGRTAGEFKDTLEVVHQDGSQMTYCNAIFGWLNPMWFAIWTEHCGVHVFHGGDIRHVAKVKKDYEYVNNDNEA
jgi:hypothetical protein